MPNEDDADKDNLKYPGTIFVYYQGLWIKPKGTNKRMVTNHYFVGSCRNMIYYMRKDCVKQYDPTKKFNLEDYCIDKHVKIIDLGEMLQGRKTLRSNF